MPNKKQTSRKMATKASKALSSKSSSAATKKLAASDLSQARGRKSGKKR